MPTVKVRRDIEVPEGPYCDGCAHIRMENHQTTWADGLGSPGSFFTYHCGAFDVGLTQESIPADTKPGSRWVHRKTAACCAEGRPA